MDIATQVRIWREAAAAGQMDREMAREGVKHLRADRKMSVEVQEIKKVRKGAKDVNALLEDFGNSMKDVEK
jgi:hypothetical protein